MSDSSEASLFTCMTEGRRQVITRIPIAAGAAIVRLRGPLLPAPDRHSIQLAVDRHLGRGGGIDDEINHACCANGYIDFLALTLRAKRPILPGEEITLNYCATEETLAEPFVCNCGGPGCYGMVRGFRFLSTAQQAELRPDLSPYLREKYFPFGESV